NTLFFLARQQGWRDFSSSIDPPKVMSSKETRQKIEAAARSNENEGRRDSKAIDVWRTGEPAPKSHPYIVKKHGMADGLRIYPESDRPLTIRGKSVGGWLMVPCTDVDGTLRTIQFISS